MTIEQTRDLAVGRADVAAQESLRLLGLDGADWITARGDVDHDVAVIGAGQSGVTIAHALRRAGVARVTVIDAGRNESASAWRSRARMRTLRTAKTVSGPELGNAALTFRAWFETVHGPEGFDHLDRIATGQWADYLDWFREQVGIDVRRDTTVTEIGPAGTVLRLRLQCAGREWTERFRKVVLASGVSGTGGPHVPAVLRELPRRLWAHTADDIDFASLRGKSVAVLGAAASAYDAAAAALESGAGDVHVYTRRPQVVVADPTSRPNPLTQDVFHHLPDAERWQRRWTAAAAGASVPLDSVSRAAAFDDYHLHVSAPWHATSEVDARVRVEAADGVRSFDYVIVATGYQQNPATRSELASIAPFIAQWRDVYSPPPDLENELLGVAPYLGPDYEFTEKRVGTAPWLSGIHVFSIGASTSFGRPVGDIPSLRVGVPRLVAAITRDLTLSDLRAART